MRRSPAQIAEALAQLELHGGNVHRAARGTGIPRSTLILWRNKALAAQPDRESLTPADPEKQDFAALWAAKEAMVLELVGKMAADASFRDLSIFAGIAADKHLDYSHGRRGATVNVEQQVNVHADALIASIIRQG